MCKLFQFNAKRLKGQNDRNSTDGRGKQSAAMLVTCDNILSFHLNLPFRFRMDLGREIIFCGRKKIIKLKSIHFSGTTQKRKEGEFNLQTPARLKHGNVTIFEELDSTPHSTVASPDSLLEHLCMDRRRKILCRRGGWRGVGDGWKIKIHFRLTPQAIFLFPKR